VTSLQHHAQPLLELEIHVVAGGGRGGGLKTLTGVASSAAMLLETLRTTSIQENKLSKAIL